jgi:hypothetical protein
MSTRACVVSLLKVVDSSLGDENLEFQPSVGLATIGERAAIPS